MFAKKLHIFVLFTIAMIAFACKETEHKNEELLRAEELLQEYPDSALTILRAIEPTELKNDFSKALWCLKYNHALYKNYLPVNTDSLLTHSIAYFENKNYPAYLGEAYYLLGSTYYVDEKYDDAVTWFKKAQSSLANTDSYHIAGMVEYNLGYIYHALHNFTVAPDYFRTALSYFTATNNDKFKGYCYRQIGSLISKAEGNHDSVMHYLDLAESHSFKCGDLAHYYETIGLKGELIIQDETNKAKPYLLRAYNALDYKRNYYAPFLAYAYAKAEMFDSAQYYLDQIAAETYENNMLVNFAAAYSYAFKSDYQKAYDYLSQGTSLRETDLGKVLKSKVHELNKQYDLTQKEKENLNLKITNRNYIIALATLIMVVLLMVYAVRVRRLQQSALIAKHENEQQKMLLENQEVKHANEQKRSELLNNFKNRIQHSVSLKKLEIGMQNQKKIVEYLRSIVEKSIITDTEWDTYIDEINKILDNKIDLLKSDYPSLTKNDIITIILSYLNFDITESALLLNLKNETVYHRRMILKKRLKLNQDQELETWIMSFFMIAPEIKTLKKARI